jgi:hypothetical protein
MPFEIINFFLFANIKDFDLSLAVSNGDFVIVAEGDRANIVVRLTCFVEPGNLG